LLTDPEREDYQAAAMYDSATRAHQVQGLSGAAASLCMAYAQLAVIGYEAFAVELLGVLDAIDGQIARLESVPDDLR
jgi:hypothetical protein